MKFSNIDELQAWLTAVAINTATWGQDGAKTVEALWEELAAGETQLQAHPLQHPQPCRAGRRAARGRFLARQCGIRNAILVASLQFLFPSKEVTERQSCLP